MSTKPTDIALWSTSHANEVAPDGGQIASGWTFGEIPPSGIANWMDRVAGEWQQYLSDGDFQGAATFESTVSFVGVPTFHQGAVVSADKDITFSGEGKVNHGDYHASVGVLGARLVNTTGTLIEVLEGTGITSMELDTSGGILKVELPMFKPGDRIKSMRIAYASSGGAPTPILVAEAYGQAPFTYALTADGATTDTSFGVTVLTWNVDSPVALWLCNILAHGLFARRYCLKIRAEAPSTKFFGADFVYDSVDVVSAA